MTLEKFNSTLVINQRISAQIADFELVNSELRENGAAIRLNYREIKSKKTKKWQILTVIHEKTRIFLSVRVCVHIPLRVLVHIPLRVLVRPIF